MAELKNRPQTEKEFYDKMAGLTGPQKKRLLALVGDPPDWTKVDDAFWKKIEEEIQQQLIIILLQITSTSMKEHGVSGIADVVARSYAIKHAGEQASSFVASSRKMVEKAAQGQRQVSINPLDLPDASAPKVFSKGMTPAETIAEQIFGKQRIETFIVTETTAAQSAGSEAAAAVLGRSDSDLWNTENDGQECPICGELHKAPRYEWMRQFPLGPPAHPNCRCWIQYANILTPAPPYELSGV